MAVREVGNEVNGDWVGAPSDVARKAQAAYDMVHRRDGRTALTLYENAGCGDDSAELSPIAWEEHFLPARLRSGLDYVLLSYYEPQCAGQRPSPAGWMRRFVALHRVFPDARLGFGEIGLPEPAKVSTRPAAASIIVPRASSTLWAALAGAWSPPPMHRVVAWSTSAGVTPPPPRAAFSYQLGGPFRVGAGVAVVDRDRHDRRLTPTASAT